MLTDGRLRRDSYRYRAMVKFYLFYLSNSPPVAVGYDLAGVAIIAIVDDGFFDLSSKGPDEP
jgi:hypothetical protein